MTDESPVIIRDYQLETPSVCRAPDGQDDGSHYVTGLIAPYDTEITASEIRGGKTFPIREVIRRGAFRQTINRRGAGVPLQFYHPNPFDQYANQNIVGISTAWEDTPQGQRATFRMMKNGTAEEALELVREGLVSSMSIHAEAVQTSTKRTNGKLPLMERTELNLKGVALVPQGAYAAAGVEAVRAEDIDEDPELVRLKGLVARLKNSRNYRI